MHKYTKLVLVALTATIILTMAAASASALRSLSLNPAGTIRATSVALSFTSPEEAGVTITSNVTLTGSLERAIQKREGGVVGTITRCETTRETITGAPERTTVSVECVRLVPFRILYKTFLGTLPSITGILVLIRAGFLISIKNNGIPVNECLYEGNVGALGRIAAGTLSTLDILAADQAITLFRTLEQLIRACNRNGRLAGSFTLNPAQRVTLV
jgi:hypothetical protein